MHKREKNGFLWHFCIGIELYFVNFLFFPLKK